MNKERSKLKMAIIAGAGACKFLGIKRLSLATEAEMKNLELTPGLVPPLGHEFPIYMDKKLLEVDYFYDGTGHKLFGLKMKVGDLLKVNKAKLIDVTVYEEGFTKKTLRHVHG